MTVRNHDEHVCGGFRSQEKAINGSISSKAGFILADVYVIGERFRTFRYIHHIRIIPDNTVFSMKRKLLEAKKGFAVHQDMETRESLPLYGDFYLAKARSYEEKIWKKQM